MSDYIKRDDALNIDFKIIVRAFENRKTTATNAVQAYADAIAKIPSENVRPVVRGKWLNDFCGKGRFSKRIVQCSLCGNFLDLDGVNAGRGDANYCPNCGADMRGES